jgi:hypothetical protein
MLTFGFTDWGLKMAKIDSMNPRFDGDEDTVRGWFVSSADGLNILMIDPMKSFRIAGTCCCTGFRTSTS